MGSKNKSSSGNGRICSIFYLIGLCGLFYLIGAWRKGGTGKGDRIAMNVNRLTECEILPDLRFESHHNEKGISEPSEPEAKVFEPCDVQYTDYTPCYERDRTMGYPTENMIHRERNCPSHREKLNCLIPAPKGYMTPFLWPKSRDIVYYANVPYKSLKEEKATQNWALFQGNVLRFPSRGTMFPQGVDAYIDELASVVPIANGSIRTALDIGCGEASWGAYMLKRNVMTMSFGPKDSEEAQVQLALERGVPAVIGVLGTIHLPYPSGAFDMAHCSRCLIPWTSNGGMYLMEMDRILRPGGYWILSGPPINWKTQQSSLKQSQEDLEAEQKKIEELAESICWEKKYENGDIAIWRKKLSPESCQSQSANLCINSDNADDVWYKKMEACKTPFSEATREGEDDGEELKEFPGQQTMEKACLGGFAAALESPNSWVMNVVPTIAQDTLGVIYERGLIGIYHDWCEGFSTYPRTYDLVHAQGLFSLYQDKCSMEDILLEMDRILRPEGAVIIRDEADVVNKVRKIVRGMRWEAKMLDHEDGPIVPYKILIAVKQYWVGNSTTDGK
ncbi:hypothetical protein K1719_029187 [Acacia pycnantha]|nr:hypothetical protein K1719_029187 [Acacia pycnantha]